MVVEHHHLEVLLELEEDLAALKVPVVVVEVPLQVEEEEVAQQEVVVVVDLQVVLHQVGVEVVDILVYCSPTSTDHPEHLSQRNQDHRVAKVCSDASSKAPTVCHFLTSLVVLVLEWDCLLSLPWNVT